MAMARVIQGSIDSGEEPMMSREEISELSGDLLRANPDISSSYAQFEVNGYDNLDQILTGDDSRIETSGATAPQDRKSEDEKRYANRCLEKRHGVPLWMKAENTNEIPSMPLLAARTVSLRPC